MSDFEARLQNAWDRGMSSGEVIYSQSTSIFCRDREVPSEARYLPCLDKKPDPDENEDQAADAAEEQQGPCRAKGADDAGRKQSKASYDPFAAPRDNVVEEMAEYTCVLNKYALEPGHFLVVTNDFYPQKGLLRGCDLRMIYDTLLRCHSERRYCFFNGGQLAGASQEHRHFQFLTIPEYDTDCWSEQIFKAAPHSTALQSHPDIPAHHFLLPLMDTSTEALLSSFKRLHKAAQRATSTDDEAMPYNFLMTRAFMLIFPRRNEEWDAHEIGVGGTCLVGSIMVTKPRELEIVKRTGLCEILRYVGWPK